MSRTAWNERLLHITRLGDYNPPDLSALFSKLHLSQMFLRVSIGSAWSELAHLI